MDMSILQQMPHAGVSSKYVARCWQSSSIRCANPTARMDWLSGVAVQSRSLIGSDALHKCTRELISDVWK